jgi:hypothetical protein
MVDKIAPDDSPVRLLLIPAYFVHAFWIGSEDNARLVLIHKPDSVSGLDYGQAYAASEFLRRLIQQPHVIGIPPERAR